MISAPGSMPYYEFSPVAASVVDSCYEAGWVQPFDWVEIRALHQLCANELLSTSSPPGPWAFVLK